MTKVFQRRSALHLTQAEAARRANVSLSYWTFIERGLLPSAAIQKRVATTLDTTTEALWNYDAPDVPTTPAAKGPTVAELRKRDDTDAREWLRTPPHQRHGLPDE